MEKAIYTSPDGFQTDSVCIESMIRGCGLGATKYGFRPLLQAISICFENPEYLEKGKGLYQAVAEWIAQHSSLAVTPERIKANIRTSINYMWRERRQIHKGKCPAYPFTTPHFIARAIEALKFTNDPLEFKKIIWNTGTNNSQLGNQLL